MELFTARVCPFSQRARLALLEKAIPFDHSEVDLANKPQRFLAISPHGKVPALVDRGHVIHESTVINEYLEEIQPHPRLLPEAPLPRAQARIWIKFCDEHFIDDYYALLGTLDPTEYRALIEKVTAHFLFIEREALQKHAGPYWLGSEISLADLAWYPFFERLPAWEHFRELTLPDECVRLKGWISAMSRRASVRETATESSYIIERYRKYAQRQI